VSRREDAIAAAKEQLRDSGDDRHVVHAVRLLEQLGSDREKRIQRFRDWYSEHFPELESEIDDDETFLNVLSGGLEREEVEGFENLAESSTGSEIGDAALEMMESVLESLEDDQELEKELREYISRACESEMPNLSELLGPVLTAKLLAHAGSLEELAKKPSSTVQMLGAEKALFRYLRGEGTPPKHGVIFEHAFVKPLPESERGKMARFLANKASIAARLDQYGEKRKGGELREECRVKFEELSEE
jgi:nucleolar protein 56